MNEDSSIIGYVDVLEISENSILIEGWALSISIKKPVDWIEIQIYDDIKIIKPEFIRNDVISYLSYPGCEYCGFKTILPIQKNVELIISVYGVSGFDRNRLIMINND